MSFSSGLSGVAAANKDLAITGNNIANASTTGFKGSRAEFGDAYTSSFIGMGQDQVGSGVNVSNVGQKFDQGTLTQTKSVLDLAIDGNGFFVTKAPNGDTGYTRSGIFGVDKDGYVVNNQGSVLQGFGADKNVIVGGILTDLRIDAGHQAPRGTHAIDAQINVPAGAVVLQSSGLTTRTNGLAVGVAQVGSAVNEVTTLEAIGFPTTAGTPSQILGGPIGFSGVAAGTGMTFPWQPTAVEAAYSLDVSIQGLNINAGTAALVVNIKPFSDAIVYDDVNELVDSINATIEGDSELAGKIQAVVQPSGGIRFEAKGTYATDGSNILSISDNVGGLLSSREYLNFGQTSISFIGNATPGLSIVNTDTPTQLTSSRDVLAIDSTVPGFLDGAAGIDLDMVFNLTVEGQAGLNNVTVRVPSTTNTVPDAQDGWASIADFVADLNAAIGAPGGVSGGLGFQYDAAIDRLSFTADGARGPNRTTITTVAGLNSSSVSLDDLGFTAKSVLSPNVALGQVRNDSLQVVLNGVATNVTLASPATYPDASALASAVNTGLQTAGLDTQVHAFASEGMLNFARIDAQVAGDTLEVNALAGPGGVVSAGAEQYLGLDSGAQIDDPIEVTAIAGTNLFANNGSLDLTSYAGQATTIQGNNTTELTFADLVPGDTTVLSTAIALPLGNIATGEAVGAVMAFSMTIGAVTDTVSLAIPAGGWTGATATDDFLTDLESAINTAPNFQAGIGTAAVAVSRDAATGFISIVSDDAGIGPVEINIVDQTAAAAVPSTVTPTTLGLASVSSPVPTRILGAADVAATNILEITVDGGVSQFLTIPENTYASSTELVATINDLINANPTLFGQIQASQINDRLVFERTEIAAYPIDIAITGSTDALATFGLTSSTKISGEEPIDRTNSFRVNLTVPLPDADNRSGSVDVSLTEKIYSMSQLAASINRELAAVPEADYIGVSAVVGRDADDNEVLQFVASVSGEASQVSISNIQASGGDLDVNAIHALLQSDEFQSDLLTIGEQGNTNGYPEQAVLLYDSKNDIRTNLTIPESSQASEIAAQLSALDGVTATAETEVRLLAADYVNGGGMEFFVNGQIIVADDLQGIVDEINSYSGTLLSNIDASLDPVTGDAVIMSSIGIDISIAIESLTSTDGVTIQGASGTPPLTLGRVVDGDTNARVGGSVDIILNEGFTLSEPVPRVAGLFGGLTSSSFSDIVINAFDPDDSNTYNDTGSLTAYDSLGNQHQVQLYYVKDQGDPEQPLALNSWTVYAQIDGENVGDPDPALPFPENSVPTFASFTLNFNADGTLNEGSAGDFLISNWDPIDDAGMSNGAYSSLNVAEGGIQPIPDPNLNSNFTISFGGTTQYGGPFARYNFQQDGYSSGRLKDLEIDTDGTVYARYTNGESEALGQVALASFANMEGLTAVGQTTWQESFESGGPTIGVAGTGLLGTVQSATLEDSTVDLSQQLVHLIIAQRNYQASAKTIETTNAVTQTIINLR
ncbi:MAG: flagellar hook-basal body complex protein [Reinekea forsetii]|nr:flagellar hook-basal body complex protein [Reinekea forsetii]